MTFKQLHPRAADSILTVDTTADLPASAQEGDARYVKNEDVIYTYDGADWNPAAGGVGGPGTTVTDNAVARFDGTTGNSIQASSVTIDDSGNIATAGTVDGRDVSTDGAALDAHVAATTAHGSDGAVVGQNTLDAVETALQADIDTRALESDLQDFIDQKGAASGLATLDGSSKIPTAQLPGLALTDVYTVADEAAQLALTAEEGDIAIRTDESKTYAHNGGTAGTMADWSELLTPTDVVTSVNGQTGVVSLAHGDLASGTGTNTHAQIDTALATAATHQANTSNPHSVTATQVGLGNVDNTSDATKNAAAVVLTNKDIDGGTASNTSRITVPKASKSTLDGLTRKEGTLVYASDLDTLYADNGTTLTPVGAGSSGELNLIDNPSDAYAGWSETGTRFNGYPTTTTTAGDLPLAGIIDTAIQIVSSTTVAGDETTDYVSYAFTTPASYAVKTKVEFWMRPGSNFVASEWTVSVYAGSTRQSLTTDSSDLTYLPNASGKFTTYFHPVASTAYTLRFTRRVAGAAAAATLNIANVIVGPGIQPQGYAGEQWSTFTGITGAGYGTGSATITAVGRREGDSVRLVVRHLKDGDAGSGATAISITLPSTHTPTTAKILSGHVGQATWSGANFGPAVDCFVSGTRDILVRENGTATNFTGADMTASGELNYELLIPIDEFAGGTVNLAQNDVEWAADDGSNDVFGPAGALVPNQSATTGATNRNFSFVGSRQDSDLLICEINYQGLGWTEASGMFPYSKGNNGSSSNEYGVRAFWSSATNYRVVFGNQGNGVSASNADAGVASWATEYAAGTRFRVRKISGGQAVGFGLATGSSSGLVSYYQEGTTSSTFTFNGSGGTTSEATIKYTRVGNLVTLTIPAVSGTSGTSSTSLTSNTVIDSWARPTGSSIGVAGYWVRDNSLGVNTLGSFVVQTSGTIIFFKEVNQSGTWTNASSCGSNAAFTISYVV